MSPFPQALQFVVVALAGWINQQQRDVIDYLQEETRVAGEFVGIRELLDVLFRSMLSSPKFAAVVLQRATRGRQMCR